MTRILMVCLGNICRSPLAEGILKSKVDSQKVFIDSAGTGGYHIGKLPDSRSIAVAKKYNLDITDQRCRKFKQSDFDEFDLIFVMDAFNKEDVLSLARNENDRAKVKMILNEVFPNENVDVPDPYHDTERGFENVYQMLNRACAIIADKLNNGQY
ncbi:low molecular weight protein-tyrosine-phosphatase [Aureibaculum sp. 2210JD6-5]|uniref:low molecular weight protein-tyrosine-phosphatase n=1 Tax=Aureibaculum sp. 2210JD6-5 TaxID=3103957 RepID=UPI002AAD1925|nr:low molecular weight protein-tyrosine-phosphatase [Aureibaculum sp. 2210JD6-5]MDY7393737.1 low molecular weight protein-tyrosine-phosphatase [Aureibaculum sp. 2210JD6-5]